MKLSSSMSIVDFGQINISWKEKSQNIPTIEKWHKIIWHHSDILFVNFEEIHIQGHSLLSTHCCYLLLLYALFLSNHFQTKVLFGFSKEIFSKKLSPNKAYKKLKKKKMKRIRKKIKKNQFQTAAFLLHQIWLFTIAVVFQKVH